MTEKEFLSQKQAAIERMREYDARSHINNSSSAHRMPPVPSFVKMPEKNTQTHKNHVPPPTAAKPPEPKPQTQTELTAQRKGIGIPFLDNLLTDSDSALVLGLLLILLSDNCDKTLLFALVYILL